MQMRVKRPGRPAKLARARSREHGRHRGRVWFHHEVRRRWHGVAAGRATTSPINPRIRSRKTASDKASARRRASARSQRAAVRLPGVDRGQQARRGRVCVSESDRVVDRLGHAPAAERDHGHAARERLDRHDPEIFIAREKQGAATAIMVANHVIRLPAQELRPNVPPSPRAAVARGLRRSRSAAGPTACTRRPPGRCACTARAPRRPDNRRSAATHRLPGCRTRRSTGGWITRLSRR